MPGRGQGSEGAADRAGTAAAGVSRLPPESGLQRPHSRAAAFAPGPGQERSETSEGHEDPRGSEGSRGCGPRRVDGWRPGGFVLGRRGLASRASPASGAGTPEPQLAPGVRGGWAGGGGGRRRSEPARPGPSGAALLLRLGAGKNVPSHGAALGGS